MRIVIAGGGIVGLTAGLALKSMGADVTVCEQADEIRAAGAAIGLWDNALGVFSEFGVGPAINSIGTPVETWFFNARGDRFRAPGFGRADHAFSLFPRPELNRVLAQAVGAQNIRVGAKVVGFDEHPDHVDVLFADGQSQAADLLVGADGVYSVVRNRLVPGYAAEEHRGHHVWRAMLPATNEPVEGSVLTVGAHRTRGGFSHTYGNQVVWMVNQFDSAVPSANKKQEAMHRAKLLSEAGWNTALLQLIERTPEERIIHTQVMRVPALPRWTSSRVALMGDAAHGLSPHISSGGTLGIEDVRVLVRALQRYTTVNEALAAYEANRVPHYRIVHELAYAVEQVKDAQEYAAEYAKFSHWMLNDGARTSEKIASR